MADDGLWRPTGWRGQRRIEFQLGLPGGARATVYLGTDDRWYGYTGFWAHEKQKRRRSWRKVVDARRAIEEQLMRELQTGISELKRSRRG